MSTTSQNGRLPACTVTVVAGLIFSTILTQKEKRNEDEEVEHLSHIKYSNQPNCALHAKLATMLYKKGKWRFPSLTVVCLLVLLKNKIFPRSFSGKGLSKHNKIMCFQIKEDDALPPPPIEAKAKPLSYGMAALPSYFIWSQFVQWCPESGPMIENKG